MTKTHCTQYTHKLLEIQLQLGQHSDSYRSQGGSSGKVHAEPARTSERNQSTCHNTGTENDGFQTQESNHQIKTINAGSNELDGRPQTKKSNKRH